METLESLPHLETKTVISSFPVLLLNLGHTPSPQYSLGAAPVLLSERREGVSDPNLLGWYWSHSHQYDQQDGLNRGCRGSHGMGTNSSTAGDKVMSSKAGDQVVPKLVLVF